MPSVLARLPSGARVLVIRLRSLGDCVLTTPALQILRAARPDIRVAVVVEKRFSAVFEGDPNLAAILPPEAGAVRRWKPELTLNLHGGTRSALLTIASGARFRAGFRHFPFRVAYNVRIPTAQEILKVSRKVHTAEHLASAMFFLGAPRMEIPRAKLFQTVPPPEARGPYAVLHAFASAADKAWSADGFVRMARHLRAAGELEPVIIGAAADDFSAFREFQCAAGLPLPELKALVAGASVFAGNDSGPAHMAAAFGVPSVVLFGSSDPVIWAPWKTTSQVLRASPIDAIPLPEVIAALDRLRVPA
jgi:heptosyltransferase III